MPRLARLDGPWVLHHLMIRGIERRKIFWNDQDREGFLDRLSKLLPETGTPCYAWALIPNHAHIFSIPAVLGKAEEKFDRKYELKRLGYDLGRVAARVCEIFELKEQDIFSIGKQQRKVKARSLLC